MIISKGIAIDLGTTNSAVAVMDPTDSEVHIYSDKQSRRTVPSCIWRKKKGGPIVVGHEAFARRGGRPEPVVSIKRKMGTTLLTPFGPATDIPENIPEGLWKNLADSQEQRQQIHLDTIADDTMREKAKRNPQLLWLPEELSACLVNDLRGRISAKLQEMAVTEETFVADRGIITIPAYFDMEQIEATREAGRLAGIEVIDLLHEPTAAAVYYSWRHQISDGIFMVYDLGGGTFDVSILRRTGGEFEVLGISGDNFLGGDDFDRLLAEWIRKRLVDDNYALELNVDSDPEDAIRFRQLIALAEKVKKELSDKDSYLLRDQNTLVDKEEEKVFIEMEIQRSDFEELIREVIWRTLPKCWEGLARANRRAGITPKEVDYILLVGGSTNIPLVQQEVRDHFCAKGEDPPGIDNEEQENLLGRVNDELREIARTLMAKNELAKCIEPVLDSPGTCVALGAAIRATSAGTYVYDDDRRVRIFFRGQGGTSKETCDLMGFVQSGDCSEPLTDVSIELSGPDESVIAEEMVDAKGHFHFHGLDLADEAVTAFNIAIIDQTGEAIARISKKMSHSEKHHDIGSVLSTAVLSKPIFLEIAEQDRVIRKILLEEGASLPGSGSFRFYLRDRSGLIRFPLYQGNRPIREVTVHINQSLDLGTPVDMVIHCDEQMHIRMDVNVDSHEFDVDIGPPPPPSTPTHEIIVEFIAEFNSGLSALDDDDRTSYEQRCNALLGDLNRAMAAGDHAKAISKFADLKGLLKDMDLHTPKLEPPWGDVEKMYAELLDRIGFAQVVLENFDDETNRARIEKFREEARSALQAEDQQLYSESIASLRSFGEALQKQVAEKMMGGQKPDIPEDKVATMELTNIRQGVKMLTLLAFTTGRNDLLEPLQTIDTEAEEMEARIATAPREVINWCQAKRNDFNRYKSQLGPSEKAGMNLQDGLLGASASVSTQDFKVNKNFGGIKINK